MAAKTNFLNREDQRKQKRLACPATSFGSLPRFSARLAGESEQVRIPRSKSYPI